MLRSTSSMAYNNYILTQKCAAMMINSWKLTWAHTGAIEFKGSKFLLYTGAFTVKGLIMTLRIHCVL